MKMRKQLLIDLLQSYTPYKSESKISPKIIEELVSLGFTVSLDSIGNVYAVRGTALKYPLLNAHMDIVNLIDYSWYYDSKYKYDYGDYSTSYKKLIEKYVIEDEKTQKLEYLLDTLEQNEVEKLFICDECERCGKCKLAEYNMICEEFYPNSKGWTVLEGLADEWGIELPSVATGIDDGQEDLLDKVDEEEAKTKKKIDSFVVYEDTKGMLKGTGGRVLGGDDKCGIFIALELARLLKKMPMKILFTVGEEEGCIGIKKFVEEHEEWFDDVLYSITIDRRYNDNLLWKQCSKQSCTNEFAGRLAMAGIQCGIPVKLEEGTVADVIYIRELVKDSVNMSAGYFNPHDEDEYVDLAGVKKIIQWLRNFMTFENNRVQNIN